MYVTMKISNSPTTRQGMPAPYSSIRFRIYIPALVQRGRPAMNQNMPAMVTTNGLLSFRLEFLCKGSQNLFGLFVKLFWVTNQKIEDVSDDCLNHRELGIDTEEEEHREEHHRPNP